MFANIAECAPYTFNGCLRVPKYYLGVGSASAAFEAILPFTSQNLFRVRVNNILMSKFSGTRPYLTATVVNIRLTLHTRSSV